MSFTSNYHDLSQQEKDARLANYVRLKGREDRAERNAALPVAPTDDDQEMRAFLHEWTQGGEATWTPRYDLYEDPEGAIWFTVETPSTSAKGHFFASTGDYVLWGKRRQGRVIRIANAPEASTPAEHCSFGRLRIKEYDDGILHHQELEWGHFALFVHVGLGINPGKIYRNHGDGIVTIVFPKAD